MEFAIVDIETTGSHAGYDKVTEIAIFIHDGKKVIDRFHSLINPETTIPPYIVSLTGITNEMLENSPRFFEVAKDIYQFLDGRVFVAHNVNFDYNFIRNEFQSLGGDYNAKKLCTVRLSRKIFPGFPSYSLGNLCTHLGIQVNNRHRAFGDAEATVKILELLLRNDHENYIEYSLKKNSAEGLLPPNLPREQFESLPEKVGVYYFFDSKGKVIYVGKAKNIKSRVRSHFTQGSETSKNQRMINDISGVSCEPCGNELIALLYEAHEIQRLWPAYNRAQKRVSWNFGIYLYDDRNGYKRFSLGRIINGEKPLAVYRTLAEARSFLQEKVAEFTLCPKLSGLQTAKGSCFEYKIHQCNGACLGEEPPRRYNKRVEKALATMNHASISAVIIGKGRKPEESSVVWVENGIYKGFGFTLNEQSVSNVSELKECIQSYPDNQDIQKILYGFLKRDRQYRIIPINETTSTLF